MLSFIEFGRNADGSMYWGQPVEGKGGTTADEADIQKQISGNDIVVFSNLQSNNNKKTARADFPPALVPAIEFAEFPCLLKAL